MSTRGAPVVDLKTGQSIEPGVGALLEEISRLEQENGRLREFLGRTVPKLEEARDVAALLEEALDRLRGT